MKVTRIKPASQGLVRFESKLTFAQVLSIREFDPSALRHVDKDNKVLFSLEIGNCTGVGNYGMSITKTDEPTITTVVKMGSRSVEAVVALSAAVKKHMSVIEKQINKAITAFETANADIEEV